MLVSSTDWVNIKINCCEAEAHQITGKGTEVFYYVTLNSYIEELYVDTIKMMSATIEYDFKNLGEHEKRSDFLMWVIKGLHGIPLRLRDNGI